MFHTLGKVCGFFVSRYFVFGIKVCDGGGDSISPSFRSAAGMSIKLADKERLRIANDQEQRTVSVVRVFHQVMKSQVNSVNVHRLW